jgi:hypothetical protein
MGGVEALLKLLRNGLDGDAVRSIMQVGASARLKQCWLLLMVVLRNGSARTLVTSLV